MYGVAEHGQRRGAERGDLARSGHDGTRDHGAGHWAAVDHLGLALDHVRWALEHLGRAASSHNASSALASESRDLGIALGDPPLDPVVFHNQEGDFGAGFSDEVAEDGVQLVQLNNWGGGLSVDLLLDLLDDLDGLLDVLDGTWHHGDSGRVLVAVQLVGLHLGARAVVLAGRDPRRVEVVWVALAESLRESWGQVVRHPI